MKPGSAGPGVPGIHPVVFDENGVILEPGCGKAGNICNICISNKGDVGNDMTLANPEIVEETRIIPTSQH